jgi:hypothetical protein
MESQRIRISMRVEVELDQVTVISDTCFWAVHAAIKDAVAATLAEHDVSDAQVTVLRAGP